MLIRLLRHAPQGACIFGQLSVDDSALVMDTLEHLDYAIPTGFYRLRMTYSPKFQEVLPVLDGVLSRTGIRIHAGNTIRDTTGCVLVGVADTPNYRLLSSRKALNELRTYLLNYIKTHPYEEIYIDITSPDAYPLADYPCPPEAQQHVLDAQWAEPVYQRMIQQMLLAPAELS